MSLRNLGKKPRHGASARQHYAERRMPNLVSAIMLREWTLRLDPPAAVRHRAEKHLAAMKLSLKLASYREENPELFQRDSV